MKPQDFVIAYMSSIDVPYSELFRVYKNRKGTFAKAKTYKGTHIDNIRMALAHIIKSNYRFTFGQTMSIVGYSNHSSVVRAVQKANVYLETNDKQFCKVYNQIQTVWQGLKQENQICISR